jgi:predicted O-methyltransferase YrrM
VTLITDQIAKTDVNYKPHVAGAFATSVLRRLEELMPKDIKHSVETGCGKSTILFSNLSQDHTVFCLDDREHGENSSITYFQSCELTKNDRIKMELGPTQKTLPFYQGFKPYDVVLIDGPHGYPFPEIEYYYFYPHLRTGGLLIVDDVHIASIGRMADVIAEDAMPSSAARMHRRSTRRAMAGGSNSSTAAGSHAICRTWRSTFSTTKKSCPRSAQSLNRPCRHQFKLQRAFCARPRLNF